MSSKLHQALTYMVKNWKELIGYVNVGNIQIDNNCCERAVRPFTNLRKSFGGFSSENGARTAATILSFVETCKLMKKKVLVLFGGVSSEHDVSVVSARSVIENTPRDKYNLILIGITKDGRWFKYDGDVANLPEDKWLDDSEHLTRAIVSPDREDHGILVFNEDGIEKIHIDVVFPVLHGKNGEDGTIQGLLQLAQIPYVGCDATSSGVCMDKAVANAVADAFDIPQAKWCAFTQYTFNKDRQQCIEYAVNKLGFPIFVKPANAGSSVGITKAHNVNELIEAMAVAFKEDKKAVLEEFIDGHEVECAVLGNDEPIPAEVGEIKAAADFYDFDAKYNNPQSELCIPADIPEEKRNEVRVQAVKAYKALGCEGMSRVDFFVRKSDGAVLLNEINTIPGQTPISMYPKLFEAAGVPYKELIDRLIGCALSRGGKF